LTMLLGFALALALNEGVRRPRGVLRTIFFAPVVTNVVAVALIWQYAFNTNGTVNEVLANLGFAGPNWLGDPNLAMPVVILLGVWRNFGIAMVLFLAGLQGVPEEVHEAAALDGAGWWRRLWHITTPLLVPTILLVSVLLTVFYLQVFDEPYLLTDGGPLGSTETVLYWIYQQGFVLFDGGSASAGAVLLLIFGIVASIAQLTVISRRDTVELS
ncbi:carbohydrate ABC transporter permease, partial [Streptomyces griseoincarnatus]